MGPDDFREVAELMAAAILRGTNVAEEAAALRARFVEVGYTFAGDEFAPLVERLHGLI